MPETKRPLKVFLCHASIDKPKVRELYRYLKRRGIKPWFDEVDLVGGQDWQIEIPKALSTSDAIIICLTKNSVDKEGYIQKEIKFALDKALEMPEGRIFLIPVRFEECEVPFSLSRYQWVDLFDEAGYSRMMRALKFRASQLERATVELLKKDIEEEKFALEKAAREKQEREIAEKVAREKVEREKAEKAAREKLEREAAQKARREKAEREAIEKATREKAKRDMAEKDKREKAEQRAAQISALKKTFSKSFNTFKLTIPKAKPFIRIGGIIGIIFLLFWVSPWAMSQLLTFVPTTKTSLTLTPRSSAVITFTDATANPTSTLEPVMTSTKAQAPTPTRETILSPTTVNISGTEQISPIDGAKMIFVRSSGDIDSFWIDQAAVSTPMFDKFVQNTSYVTDAEKNRVGFVWTFIGDLPATQFPGQSGWVYEWKLKSDVNWKNPPFDDEYNGDEVLQVSWNDATAYCQWAGKELLTLKEWELANGSGLSITFYNRSTGLGEWGEDKTTGIYRAVLGRQDITSDGYTAYLFQEHGFVEYRSANRLTFRCKDR